jgi:hypothetical protein
MSNKRSDDEDDDRKIDAAYAAVAGKKSPKRPVPSISDDDDRKIDAAYDAAVRKRPKIDSMSNEKSTDAKTTNAAKPAAMEPIECPICLHTVSRFTAFETTCCRNLYHYRCIGSWTKFCPSCTNDQIMRFSAVKVAVRSLYCIPGCAPVFHTIRPEDRRPYNEV